MANLDKRLRWIADMDSIGDEIRKHIPIIEISLIIQDYCTTSSPHFDVYRICYHCKAKHHRTIENLCMNCRDLCLQCKNHTAVNEQSVFCRACRIANPRFQGMKFEPWDTKSRLYREWHLINFPSDIYHRYTASQKRINDAAIEKKRLEDAFFAREDAKPKDQQIAELRAKLYAAYKVLRPTGYYAPNSNPYPEYPYF